VCTSPLFATASSNKETKGQSDNRGLIVVEKDHDSRKRIALVIGNSNYRSSPLKNPVNDARAMAATLRQLGFEVEERTNLGYIAMNEAVEGFGRKLRTGGVGLFYYAGHGMQVNGSNYLIPTDARIESESEVRYKALDAGLVMSKMEQAKSDINIVVLDACRDNPFSRSFRSAGHGLASIDAPIGTIIAYATAPGKTASDGEGNKNSLFTTELVKAMETPGLRVEDVFMLTRKAVREKSANTQVPWESSSLEGKFRFIPKPTEANLQPSPVPPQQSATVSRPQAPTAQPARTGNFTDSITGMEFVRVPEGCFTADKSQVCLDAFSIGKYEVTQGQWKKVMGNNPSHFISCGDNCPVEQVSWHDAKTFITKLNKKTGKRYRLPTEAEWEYACRSGGKQEEYCGGNDINNLAWYKANSGNKTHQVGQKRANGLGIYDMSGNVWEWVGDWNDDSRPRNPRDSSGFLSDSDRVLLGGSWSNNVVDMRASDRGLSDPGNRFNNIGFRLAISED